MIDKPNCRHQVVDRITRITPIRVQALAALRMEVAVVLRGCMVGRSVADGGGVWSIDRAAARAHPKYAAVQVFPPSRVVQMIRLLVTARPTWLDSNPTKVTSPVTSGTGCQV
jgi:hypothetical protein